MNKRQDIKKLLTKLNFLVDGLRSDHIKEDFYFLCGYMSASEFPDHAEKDIEKMIEKYL